MTARKAYVIVLSHTKAVLSAVTHTGAAKPTLAELVGTGLLVRTRVRDSETSIVVPIEDLELKEVDYSDQLFRDPFTRSLDPSGTLVVPNHGMDVATTAASLPNITVAVNKTPDFPTLPSNKKFLILIDPGGERAPVKLPGNILAGSLKATVTTNDVPIGPTHLLLASVEGEGALVLEA